MMMRKLSFNRFLSISKTTSQGLMNCRISSSSFTRITKDSKEATIDPEPGDLTISRRLLHKFSIDSTKKNLIEQLRLNKLSLLPPTMEISVQDTKKLLRAAQIEVVKTKLLESGKMWISYSDFVRVCDDSCLDGSLGSFIAKMLDDSGNVIVLGNYVCLRPDQVTRSIEGLLPLPQIHNPNDPRRKELKELEAIKTIIDKKSHSLVRRELWAGLGYLIIQTTCLMRLTFWELTWDVMEPICFYVTSIYFMAGYAFFLRTSKEPSFEGFYQSRFEAKQRKLMESHEFDVERYKELKRMMFKPKVSAVSISKILGS